MTTDDASWREPDADELVALDLDDLDDLLDADELATLDAQDLDALVTLDADELRSHETRQTPAAAAAPPEEDTHE